MPLTYHVIFAPATGTLSAARVICDADAFEARVLDHYIRYLGPIAQDWGDRTPIQDKRFFATCGLEQQSAWAPDGCELHCELVFAVDQKMPCCWAI